MARQGRASDRTSPDSARASSTTLTSSTGVKKRSISSEPTGEAGRMADDGADRLRAVDGTSDVAEPVPLSTKSDGNSRWIMLALASGCCAAFNGVFAKLTTTTLTSTLSNGIAGFIGLSAFEGAIELIVRGIFFALNLIFNGVMWTLFTQALAKGNSTTQVSIMNTSSNFVITAVLGFAIFSESLPPLWWVGATMLVAGNVIIGQKDEGTAKEDSGPSAVPTDESSASYSLSDAEDGQGTYRDVPAVRTSREHAAREVDEDILELGDLEIEQPTLAR